MSQQHGIQGQLRLLTRGAALRMWAAVAVGLVVIFGLHAPARAQVEAHGEPPARITCVPLAGGVSAKEWSWKEDDNAKPFAFPGDTLTISLVPSTTPSPPPAAPPTPPGQPAPTPAATAPQPLEICAGWNSTAVPQAEAMSQRNLGLGLVEQTPTLIRLQVALNGRLPRGIRQPVWIQLASRSPALAVSPPSKLVLLSSRWLCILISTIFVAFVYLFLSLAVHSFYNKNGQGSPTIKRGWNWKMLNPTVLSAADYGSASLANLQILWFTFIVTWIMAYAWLVTGQLLSPSQQILGLLGISGGVNVVANSVTSGKQRISLDNWNWLVESNYLLPEDVIDPIEVAQWRHLVMDRGVLDPSRYQLLIFGFLVGINLLFSDMNAIETFAVPSFFVALQGVSGGLYLFGKLVSPSAKDEFETFIAGLREKLKPGNVVLGPEEKRSLRRFIESLFGNKAIGSAL